MSSQELPSRAQVHEKIRDKIRKNDHILWPTVSEKIQEVKAAKRVAALKNPEVEHRTVFHLDLVRALLGGAVVDVGPATQPQPGWVATVRGLDCSGYPLVVFVHVCIEEAEPLQITDFCIAKE